MVSGISDSSVGIYPKATKTNATQVAWMALFSPVSGETAFS
ncbi:MAG: hypothetical protein ACI80V_002874 [Rhodothermales bacterium]|jgi:hypothetical protein